MSDDTIYTLVPSTNNGRYALDDPEHGSDITAGQRLTILLGGHWIEGSVEHGGDLYVNRGIHYPGEQLSEYTLEGYYFIASGGGICGLCVGMKVRLS